MATLPVALEEISLPEPKLITITWNPDIELDAKVKEGEIIGNYIISNMTEKIPIKSPFFGRLRFLAAPEIEAEVQILAKIEKCSHRFFSGLCTRCGSKKPTDESASEYKRFTFADPRFEISKTSAKDIFEKLTENTLASKKLFLILDLDNTLIHAYKIRKTVTFENPDDFKDCFELNMPDGKYLLKLRPYLKEFLEEMSKRYVIYIYTMGVRLYAELIIKIIDTEEKILSKNRIFTRDEMGRDDFKAVERAVLNGSYALILDDLPHVWNYDRKLVNTKPFFWFTEDKDKLKAQRKVDAYLRLITEVLKTAQDIFFEFKGKGTEVPLYKIYHSYRKCLMADETVSFEQFFYKNERELQKSKEYTVLKKFGAEPEFEIWGHTSFVFGKASDKQKLDKKSKLPLVSLYYITYCELFTTKLRIEDFDIENKDGVIRKMELKIKELKKKGLDYHKQIEYLAHEDAVEKLILDNFEALAPLHEKVRGLTVQKLELELKNKRAGAPLEEEEDLQKHQDRREIEEKNTKEAKEKEEEEKKDDDDDDDDDEFQIFDFKSKDEEKISENGKEENKSSSSESNVKEPEKEEEDFDPIVFEEQGSENESEENY